jgi:predicted enzyme related to lactoylglutathione lyase
LELRTGNLAGACSFYSRLLGWRPERVDVGASHYFALDIGNGIDGGVVEREAERALWLPYVEVDDVGRTTEHAQLLGASVAVERREGSTGWRSVVATEAGGEIAFWQPKR